KTPGRRSLRGWTMPEADHLRQGGKLSGFMAAGSPLVEQLQAHVGHASTKNSDVSAKPPESSASDGRRPITSRWREPAGIATSTRKPKSGYCGTRWKRCHNTAPKYQAIAVQSEIKQVSTVIRAAETIPDSIKWLEECRPKHIDTPT